MAVCSRGCRDVQHEGTDNLLPRNHPVVVFSPFLRQERMGADEGVGAGPGPGADMYWVRQVIAIAGDRLGMSTFSPTKRQSFLTR